MFLLIYLWLVYLIKDFIYLSVSFFKTYSFGIVFLKVRFHLIMSILQIGAQIKKKSANKGEWPRTSQNAYFKRRPGTSEDGPADLSRGHEAHEDRDSPFCS